MGICNICRWDTKTINLQSFQQMSVSDNISWMLPETASPMLWGVPWTLNSTVCLLMWYYTRDSNLSWKILPTWGESPHSASLCDFRGLFQLKKIWDSVISAAVRQRQCLLCKELQHRRDVLAPVPSCFQTTESTVVNHRVQTRKAVGIYWSYKIHVMFQGAPQMMALSVAQYFHSKQFMTPSFYLTVLRK